MEIQKTTLKNILIISSLILLSAFMMIAFYVISGNKESNVALGEGIRMEGDVQIIEITALGGYSPSLVKAYADKETVLRISTKNTFDCSIALRIPDLNFSENLNPTETKELKIPPQKAGSEIKGSCSMGMYHFKIKFS